MGWEVYPCCGPLYAGSAWGKVGSSVGLWGWIWVNTTPQSLESSSSAAAEPKCQGILPSLEEFPSDKSLCELTKVNHN